jgi:hypothetical protein
MDVKRKQISKVTSKGKQSVGNKLCLKFAFLMRKPNYEFAFIYKLFSTKHVTNSYALSRQLKGNRKKVRKVM